MNKEVFDLTPAQAKIFKDLEKAYKACSKAGILLVNNYGHLEAYNKKYVSEYSDTMYFNKGDEGVVSTHESICYNSFRIINEWADDEHLIKLTPKGLKKYHE